MSLNQLFLQKIEVFRLDDGYTATFTSNQDQSDQLYEMGPAEYQAGGNELGLNLSAAAGDAPSALMHVTELPAEEEVSFCYKDGKGNKKAKGSVILMRMPVSAADMDDSPPNITNITFTKTNNDLSDMHYEAWCILKRDDNFEFVGIEDAPDDECDTILNVNTDSGSTNFYPINLGELDFSDSCSSRKFKVMVNGTAYLELTLMLS